MTTDVILERRPVPSESRPDVEYDMIRTPSGWQHADEGCPWWLNRRGTDQSKPCQHVIDLNKESAMTTIEGSPGMEVELYQGAPVQVYQMVDEFDAQLIVQGVAQERVEDWCYAFRQAGEVIVGLSIAGVPAAVREMAKHGEVIRCDPPVIQLENENEVRLVCTARRILVAPNGDELLLDQTSRALRQPKKQKVNKRIPDPSGAKWPDGNPKMINDGYELVDDDKWFEKAYSKAVRNATLPLIRDDCRSAIIEAFKQTQKYDDVLNNRQPQRAARPAGGQSNNQAPARQSNRPRQQQQRPVAQGTEQPASNGQDAGSSPAGPSTISEPLRAKLQARALDVRTKHGNAAVGKIFESATKEYAYAVSEETGHLNISLLKTKDGEDLLAFLDRVYDGGVAAATLQAEEKPQEAGATARSASETAVASTPVTAPDTTPPASSGHEHEPIYTPHGVYVCSTCGEKLTEPEEAQP